MTDSNDRFRILRVPAEALRSLSRYLPGTALNAPKRNTLVILVYAFAFLLLVGILSVYL
ncbi:hypothetical protein [Halorubrum salsamenti]|uniref:hypothetical protein n=1 Tax=Halorubrum salsamenti TaxID=2583990 RepID=UPI001642779C|nr:hypothetical protein [Halorubrum salsamenti]